MYLKNWNDFLSNTSIHGLNLTTNQTKFFERVLFIVSFVSSLASAIYLMYNIVNQFVNSPVGTSYMRMSETQQALPDVTICPFNKFKKSAVDKIGMSENLTLFTEWSFFPSKFHYYFEGTYSIALWKWSDNETGIYSRLQQEQYDLMKANNMTLEELVSHISLSCEDVIHHCIHEGRQFNCCDTIKKINTGLGTCFRVESVMQIMDGWGQGLTIVMRLPIHDYTKSVNTAYNDGIVVKFTEPGKGYEADAIQVMPGTHTLVMLNSVKYDFINDPPRFVCRKEALNPDGTDYSPILCFQECLTSFTNEYCNCRYIGYPKSSRNGHLPVCDPTSIISCFVGNINNGRSPKECKAMCPQRCSYWQYDATTSYANFPSDIALHHLDSREELEERRKTDIILEVFYAKLQYTKIQHFPTITWESFISNIGGTFGLFCGVSMINITQFFVFLGYYIYRNVSSSKEQDENKDAASADSTMDIQNRDNIVNR